MSVFITVSSLSVLVIQFIVALIYFFLYSRTKEAFLRSWALAFLFGAASYGFDAIIFSFISHPVLIILSQFSAILNILFVLFGTYELREKKKPLSVNYLASVLFLWISYSQFDNSLSFILKSFPVSVFGAAIYLWAGISFLQMKVKNAGKQIVSFSLIIVAVYKICYPFLASFTWFISTGFILAFFLAILISLGTLVYYFHSFLLQVIRSNRFYHVVSERADDILFHYRLLPAKKFEFVSPAVKLITGYTPEDFYYEPGIIKRIIFPEDEPLLKKLLRNERNEAEVIRFINKNGSTVWLEIKTSVEKDKNGNAVTVDGVSRDITERINFEKKLAESEERYRLLFEFSSAIKLVIRFDDGLIWDANNTACEFYGYSKEEIKKKKITDINYNIDGSGFDTLRNVTKRDGYTHFFFKQLLASGEVKDVEIYTSYLRLNETDFLLSVIHDITEEWKAREALGESELRYRTLFENSSIAMFLIDAADAKIWDVNKAACRFYGYVKEELIGKQVEKYSEKINALRLSEIAELEDGKTESFKDRHVLSGGEKKDVEVHISTIIISGKKLLLTIVHDITLRVKAEEELKQYREHLEDIIKGRTIELRQSEERFRKVAESSNDSILLIDKNYRVLFANPVVEQRNPYLKDNFLNHTIGESSLPAELKTGAEGILKKVFKTQLEDRSELTLPGGRIVEFISTPVFDDYNKVEMVLSYGRDITERKKLEETIFTSLNKEKELNELKTKFISTVSHEFRTPLAAIFSSAELLERYGRKWGLEKYNEHISRIKYSINNLTALVDDVLTIGRVEASRVDFNPSANDLAELSENLVHDISLVATGKHNIELLFNISQKIYLLDERLFKLIFNNLLTNAIKYSPLGGNVIFKVSENNDFLIFEISDEGLGIPADSMAILFEPFFRGSNVKDIPGTGLGLSIVKLAVDLSKGKIFIKSELKKGTLFTVYLPKISVK